MSTRTLTDGQIVMRSLRARPLSTWITIGMVASLDGSKLIRDQARGAAEDPESIGIALALKLREQGAGEILEQIFADVRPQA